jgi:hypothetical protein
MASAVSSVQTLPLVLFALTAKLWLHHLRKDVEYVLIEVSLR